MNTNELRGLSLIVIFRQLQPFKMSDSLSKLNKIICRDFYLTQLRSSKSDHLSLRKQHNLLSDNRKRLFAGTLPAIKKLFAGNLLANKKLFIGTHPANANRFKAKIYFTKKIHLLTLLTPAGGRKGPGL